MMGTYISISSTYSKVHCSILFIVFFIGHQKILDQEMHSLGTQPLTITSYHPVLAEIEQTDSVSSKQSNIFLSFSLCIIFINKHYISLFESNTFSGFCYFSLDTASETIEMSRQPDLTSHQHIGNCYRII